MTGFEPATNSLEG